TVLHQGRVIAEGAPAEIQKNAEVQTAYLGHLKVAAGAGAGLARAEGAPLLAVVSVDAFYGKSHVLHDVSLDVFPGEVVALLGRNGAGKTTTLAAITGVVPPRRGRITYRGRDITGGAPRPLRARAWAWCRRGGGFFRTSACSRTSPSPVAAGAAGGSSASSRRFPGCISCATPAAGRCRAASCSCWPSPARSWATSSCCCSTSPSRGSRRRSSRRYGTSCTRSR